MRFRTVALHAGAWLAVYAGWLAATRPYHPTRAIAVGATAVLVGASAGAVYANQLRLIPRLAARGSPRWHYSAALLATVGLVDLAAVVVIQLIYASLWHPDPRRFGFGFNVAADGAIIAVHVAVAAVLVSLARRWAGAAPVRAAA